MDPVESFSGRSEINRWKYFFIQYATEEWNSLQQSILDDQNGQQTKKTQIVKIHKHSGADEAPSQGFAKLLTMKALITE